ncbi:MAG: hypothetical protein WD000_09825 [Thermodesulfobacteriota bacterium]
MVNISRNFVLFMVGLALLLPLSNFALAEPERNYGTGQYNFFSDWMSPKVEPIESKVLFVSEYSKRDFQPREELTQATASAPPVTRNGKGQYNFYIDWMSPRIEPMDSKAVVLEYKAKSIELEDILPSISTISSNDKKIVGVVLPPFAYFSKTF